MIEETHTNDDSYIVRVKAVVMTRDDSSGGWLAQEGGGLSRVGVCKVAPTELSGHSDFLIHGERLKDKQTATDSSSNSSQKKEQIMQPLTTSTFYEPHRHHHQYILGHFHEQYRSSERYFLDQAAPRLARRVSFLDEEEEVVRINPRERAWLSGYEDYRHAAARAQGLDSYVHFAKGDAPAKHDYSYPYAPGSELNKGPRRGSGVGAVVSQPISFKHKEDEEEGLGERRHCVYCGVFFRHEENGRGRCPDAPDPVRLCIRRFSCMWCADSLLYHCMSDPEGDYSDPCSCDTADERFCLRWLALFGLALLAPCLCCYPPLHACHRCAVACGCCGGKHKAAA